VFPLNLPPNNTERSLSSTVQFFRGFESLVHLFVDQFCKYWSLACFLLFSY
jgi:hypothetical protein